MAWLLVVVLLVLLSHLESSLTVEAKVKGPFFLPATAAAAAGTATAVMMVVERESWLAWWKSLFFIGSFESLCARDAFNWPLNGCLGSDEALATALSELSKRLSPTRNA